jgi:hypothetical protein
MSKPGKNSLIISTKIDHVILITYYPEYAFVNGLQKSFLAFENGFNHKLK